MHGKCVFLSLLHNASVQFRSITKKCLKWALSSCTCNLLLFRHKCFQIFAIGDCGEHHSITPLFPNIKGKLFFFFQNIFLNICAYKFQFIFLTIKEVKELVLYYTFFSYQGVLLCFLVVYRLLKRLFYLGPWNRVYGWKSNWISGQSVTVENEIPLEQQQYIMTHDYDFLLVFNKMCIA